MNKINRTGKPVIPIAVLSGKVQVFRYAKDRKTI